MASKKYKQLNIDGVIGDVWDDAAVHEEDVVEVVLAVLNDSTIRAALLDMYHPIGSYYFTDRNVNPGTFLGGTWTNVEGRVLLGASSKYPVNSEGGYTDATLPTHNHSASGSTTSAGAHTHSFSGSTAAAGNHNHVPASPNTGDAGFCGMRSIGGASGAMSVAGGYSSNNLCGWGAGQWSYLGLSRGTANAGNHSHSFSGSTSSAGAHTHTVTVTTADVGEDGKDKNMMPYKSAYIWVRTA